MGRAAASGLGVTFSPAAMRYECPVSEGRTSIFEDRRQPSSWARVIRRPGRADALPWLVFGAALVAGVVLARALDRRANGH